MPSCSWPFHIALATGRLRGFFGAGAAEDADDAADTVAAFGLHGALLIGPRHPIRGAEDPWVASLATFEIDLNCDGNLADHGAARNVLDGPLFALRHLVEVLAEDGNNPPLAAGEIVTTGTLTRALPILQ